MHIPKSLLKFIQLIHRNKGKIRLIGGCVRDSLMQINSSDIDLACDLASEKITLICEQNHIKTIPTGLKHGTITVVLNKSNYEVTTLRRDVVSTGRHAEVKFTQDWFFDAARRDFTFNALSLEIDEHDNQQIFDYFNGISDLKNGILRFIGNPQQRIQEDYLRILRAFRFYARFCFQPIDPAISKAIITEKHNIEQLSGERIKNEIFNILSKKNSFVSLNLIQKHHLNGYIFGKENEFDLSLLQKINQHNITQNPLIILSLLIINNDLDMKFFTNRWKISRKEQVSLKNLIAEQFFFPMDAKNHILRPILAKFDRDFHSDLVTMNFLKEFGAAINPQNLKQLRQMQQHVQNLIIKKNPVTGNDFKHLTGKKIGLALQIAEQIWHQSDYQMSKNEIIEQVKQNLIR